MYKVPQRWYIIAEFLPKKLKINFLAKKNVGKYLLKRTGNFEVNVGQYYIDTGTRVCQESVKQIYIELHYLPFIHVLGPFILQKISLTF